MSDGDGVGSSGKARLQADFERVAGELGHPPTTGEYNTHGQYTYGAFYTYWDDWDAVVEATGADPAAVPQPGVTRDAFVEDLRAVATDLGRVPTMQTYADEGAYSMNLVYKFFESYRDAVAEAGLDVAEVGKQVSREALLAELRAGYHALGYPPTMSDMDAVGEYGVYVYRDRFGSWAAAFDAAGIPIPESRRRTDADD